MARTRSYQVKEVARIAGVSVRTLHHYDEIGLLVPRGRTNAGYRLYDDEDLLRLQQILIGRELGLALEEIRRSLDDPEFDKQRALLEQREQLAQRARQTEAMLRAVDAALALLATRPPQKQGDTMDMKELFDGFDPRQYETEAEQRWGNSDAYKEAMKRTRRYGKEDWQRCAAEQSGVYTDAFELKEAGHATESTEAMDVAERHRLSIERWFYPCSYAMHTGLADMYEQDSRFAENIDKHGAGLTPFLSAAIRANAKRHGHGS
jgi:MerR family transcriptional regulator, thiopeptide resistance regulator